MDELNFLLEHYTQAMVAKLLGYSHRSSLTHMINSGIIPTHKKGILRIECEKIRNGYVDFTKKVFAKDVLIVKEIKEKPPVIKCQKSRKTYKAWYNMISRCNNPDNGNFKYYGARGITVDRDWYCFDNFLRDMGKSPPNMVLDRINVDGNYCKKNCRWTDYATSNKNKRKKTRNNS
jgi:hypothetical protein